jgi:hypothetical protein
VTDLHTLLIALLLVVVGVAAFWDWRSESHIARRQASFFDLGLMRADEALQQLAAALHGRFEQGQNRWLPIIKPYVSSGYDAQFGLSHDIRHLTISEGGSSTYCVYRGFPVRVTWSTEDLEEGMALVPRLVVEIPPDRVLARLRFTWHPAPECNSAVILLRRHQRGISDGAVNPARLSSDEARLFSLLADRSSEIAQRSPTLIDIRALPSKGQWDETGRYYRDDFDPGRLRELAELAALFAEAATTP